MKNFLQIPILVTRRLFGCTLAVALLAAFVLETSNSLAQCFTPVNFSSPSNLSTATGGTQLSTTGDVNGDGIPDILAANIGTNTVTTLLGTGNGTFVSAGTTTVGNLPVSIAIADFNGDGKADMAVSDQSSNITVHLGNGDGTFGSAVATLSGAYSSAVAAGDFNGDGKADLVRSNGSPNTVSVYLGNGNGTFQTAVSYAVGTNPRFVAVGDVNGDGKPDLVTANQNSNNISVLVGNGDGTFQTHVDFPAASTTYGIAIADFNGDGKPDIAACNQGGNNVSVFINNGSGSPSFTLSLAASVPYTVGSSPQSIVTADYNGDGIADLATSNQGTSNVSVLLGKGDGTFQTHTDFPAGSSAYSIGTADFNDDSKPDLVTFNNNSNNVSVLLNTTATASANANTPVCTNGVLTLTGGPSTGVLSYSWSGPNGFTSSVQSPTIAGPTTMAAGIYGLTVTAAGGCTASAHTITVVIHAAPSPVSQTVSACGSYTVGTHTHTSSGTYTDTITSVGGCDSIVTTNLTIKTVSVVTQTLTICAGQSVTVNGHTYYSSGTYTDKFTGGAHDGCDSTVTTNLKVLFGNGGSTSFSITTGLVGNGTQISAAGDVNGDGKPDLLVALGASTIYELLGNGDGTFGAANSTGVSGLSAPSSVVIADFNGDGKADMASINSTPNNITVYLGNGSGGFAATPVATLPTGSNPTTAEVADFNGDGKLDMAVSNQGSSTLSILIGNGDGTFQPKVDYTTGTNPRFVVSADLNGDGKLDLAVPNQGSSTVSVFLGNGNGTFQSKMDFTAGSAPYGVAIADYNGDGLPDLAVVNRTSGTVSVLLNTGTFTSPFTLSFGAKTDLTVGSSPQSVTTADFNGDGKADIATSNQGSSTVSVLLNTGTFASPYTLSFAAKSDFTVGGSPYALTTADFNRDGRPDLVTFNNTSVLINTTGLPTASATSVCTNGTLSLAGGPAGFTSYSWSGPNSFTSSIQNATLVNPTTAAAGVYSLTVTGSGGCTASASTAAVVIYAAPSPVSQTLSACGSYTVGTHTHTSSGTYTDTTTAAGGCDSIVTTNLTIKTVSVVTQTLTVCAGQSVTVNGHTYRASGTYTDKFTGGAHNGCDSTVTTNLKVLFGNGGAASFGSATGLSTATGGTQLSTTGDVNGDGIPDILAANIGTNTVTTLLGTGNGTFVSAGTTTVGNLPVSIAIADFNGDGKADMAVSDQSSNITVHLGNGDGTFGSAVATLSGAYSSAVASADFNGDGKPDLVRSNGGTNTVSVYLGIGNGTFQTPVSYAVSTNPRFVAVGDVNGDGKPDLVTANQNSNNISVLVGNGDGTFQTHVDFSAASTTYGIAIADFNGDGKPDIAACNQGGNNVSVFINNGSGSPSFTLSLAASVPYTVGSSPQSIVTADYNGDGIADLATSNQGTSNVSVLLGKGDGTFQTHTDFPAGSSAYSIGTADFNDDSKPDLVTFNNNATNVSVLLNTTGLPTAGAVTPVCANGTLSLTGGPAGFTSYSWSGPNSFTRSIQNATLANPTTAAAGVYTLTVTGSGGCTASASTASVVIHAAPSPVTQTLAVCGSYTVGTHTHTSSGTYTDTTTAAGGCDSIVTTNLTIKTVSVVTQTLTVCAGQSVTVNGHTYRASGTYTDKFTGGAHNGCDSTVTTNLKVLFGNGGAASFGSATGLSTATGGTQLSTTGDVNGDGIPDILAANIGTNTVTTLLGTGNGTFVSAGTTTVGNLPVSIAIADFNGDGKADMAVSDQSSNITVHLGNGDGTFGSAVATLSGAYSSAVASADFNGDGKPDLVRSNGGTNTVSVYLGIGNGTFQTAVSYAVGTNPRFVAVGDINGDGIQDVVTANQNTNNISVLLGNGDGTFQTHVDFAAASTTYGIAIADFNGDGKADIAACNRGGNNVSIFINNGSGSPSFTLSLAASVPYTVGSSPQSIVTADYNGDGIADLATSNQGTSNVSVLLGKGDGTFQTHVDFPAGSSAYSIGTADFNNDGKPDLVTFNANATNVSVLLNITGITTAGAVTPVCTNGTLSLTGGPAGFTSYSWLGPNSFTSSVQSPTIANPTTAAAGVYSLTVTGSGGCAASASTVSVVIHATPSPVTQTLAVCGSYTVGTHTHTSSGTYTDTTTSIGGCDSIVTTNLTIKQLSVFTQTLSICAGQSVTVNGHTYYSSGTYTDKFTGGAHNGCDSTVTTKLTIFFSNGSSASFSSPSNTSTSTNGTQLSTTGDVNGDGIQDIVVANAGPNTVSVLLGNGNGTFGAAKNTNVGLLPISVALADFNNDGKADMAVSDQSNNITVYLGNGDGTFGSVVSTLSGTFSSAVASADFNGDGKADLVRSNGSANTVSVYMGNGNGTFQTAVSYAVGTNPRFVAVGDINGDGIQDVVTANQNTGNISVLLGNGNGTFQTHVDFPASTYTYGIAIADFNGDGKADIAACNRSVNNVSVFINNGSGSPSFTLSLAASVPYTVGTSPQSVVTADINGDGIADLATSNQGTSNVSVLLGKGDGTFQTHVDFPAGSSAYSIGTADFNNDGKPDLVTFNNNANNVSVLLNTIATVLPTISATATPSGICLNDNSVLAGSGGVTYSWAPSLGLTLTTGASVNASPAVNTTYTVTGTDVHGCVNTGTTTITLKTPVPLAVNPQSAVCTGQTNAVLTASGAATYVWAPTGNLTPSAGTSATETAQISQLTFYTVTGTGSDGCTANTVIPVATVATGGAISPAFSIICSGGTNTLTVTGAAGHDYQWQISTDDVNWSNITGATNTTYTTASGDGNSNKFYRLMAQSNSCWNVASTTGEVDVSNPNIVVTATNITDNSLTLNWSPTGTGNYSISYSGPSSATFTSVTPAKTITGLTANGTYSITVTQTGVSGCPASGTLTGVTTLCAMPTGVTLSSPAAAQIQVSWTGVGGADYRVYYRPLFSYNTYFTKDVSNASSVLLTKQGANNLYASTTYEVYVSRLDCPTTGAVGQGTNPTNVTTLPTVTCATPVIDSVRSLCPVQIEVFIHDNGVNQYNVFLQRITPSILAVNSYGISGTYFTINTPYSGDQYLIAVEAKCGSALSSLYVYPGNVTVKPICDAPTNLVLSNPTCHGFTASWNSDQCLSNSASSYDFYMRIAGTINYNSYGASLPPAGIGPNKLVNWATAGRTYQVFVRSVYNCNGFVTYGPTSEVETITTLSSGCRDEEQTNEPQENKPATQQYSPDNSEVFSLYPNPNTGKFIVDLSRLGMEEDAVRIEIINMLGQTVLTHLTTISGGHMSEYINLPNGTAAGTYIVRLTAGKNVYTAKINVSK